MDISNCHNPPLTHTATYNSNSKTEVPLATLQARSKFSMSGSTQPFIYTEMRLLKVANRIQ